MGAAMRKGDYTQFGLSLKNADFQRIERERGLVPRSKFIALIIEQHYADGKLRDGGADAMQQQLAPAKKRPVSRTVANAPRRRLATSRGEMP